MSQRTFLPPLIFTPPVSFNLSQLVTDTSAVKFVAMLIDRGHESVIEHASASILMVTDRGVSHELVRHRLFSYTQESTRYCNYSGAKFGGEITVIKPPMDERQEFYWRSAMISSEMNYLSLGEMGATPQIARSVLPTCLKTEIVVTGNFRQWRHFLKLRTAKVAHPQMRELAVMTLVILHDVCPQVFALEAGQ